MRFNQVSIVGVGLLGGSLGKSLRQRKLAGRVVGCVRRKASLAECRRHGAVDVATLDYAAGVAEADLVVLCTPIAQMRALLLELLPHLKPGTIVTDVGSVKDGVVSGLEPLAAKAGVHFVGSHPMAGSEKMGVSAARSDLYQNAICVVTPTRKSNRKAVRAVEQLWKSVGARILRMTPGRHDQLVAKSSHVPHLMAAQLVNHVLGGKAAPELSALCATGFRDTTRIASGSPEMWRDIAIANAKNLAKELARFRCELERLETGLRQGDAALLAKFFEAAKARRDAWCECNGFTSPE